MGWLDNNGLAHFWAKIKTALAGKADKATTLSGYSITDAYTKTEVDNALSGYVATSNLATLVNPLIQAALAEYGDGDSASYGSTPIEGQYIQV